MKCRWVGRLAAMLPTLVAGLLWVCDDARAQWRLQAGFESFLWHERTRPAVQETGSLVTVAVQAREPGSEGVMLDWAARVYGGTMDYSGVTLFPPVQSAIGRSDHSGAAVEASLRQPLRSGSGAAIAGLGVEAWRRSLGNRQREDYALGYLSLGAEWQPGNQGWFGDAALKLPLWIGEDAHLDRLGFVTNPLLKPARRPSARMRTGWRFPGGLAVLLQLDLWRLGPSQAVLLDHPGQGRLLVQQPAITRATGGLVLQFEF